MGPASVVHLRVASLNNLASSQRRTGRPANPWASRWGRGAAGEEGGKGARNDGDSGDEGGGGGDGDAEEGFRVPQSSGVR